MNDVIGDSRLDFVTTWLFESPEGIGNFELADTVEYAIKDRIKNGIIPTELGNGLRKIEGQQTVMYWFEKDNKILLAAEFSIKPQALIVNMIGKFNKGQPPYASDLYNAVLQDRKSIAGSVNSIRVMSDTTLSNDGLEIWKRLLQQGHKISVYDANHPGQTFKQLETVDELITFFKDDNRSYRRWQYVLSEAGPPYAETRSFFNTRRMRELTGRL